MNSYQRSDGSFGPITTAEQKTPLALTPRPHRLAVAIVDDDNNDRWLITRDVDRSPHFETVGTFSSGPDALKEMAGSASEAVVVLIDVRMPVMSGNECARRLRNVRPNLLIILISGFDHPDAWAQAQEAGADAYLTKPFSLDQFLAALTTCLRRRRLAANETRARRNSPLTQPDETRKSALANSRVRTSGQCSGAIQHQGESAEPEQGLWIDEPTVLNALRQMVIRMEANFHTREDLLQEALVYFWSRRRLYPGRELGWYLQHVRFCLQHLRTCGRSIDSLKRRGAQVAFAENSDGWEEWLDALGFDEGIMSEVNARDIFALLLERLTPTDRTILCALAEGCGSREVAERLRISDDSVRRHQHKIATVALRVGIVSPTASPKLGKRSL